MIVNYVLFFSILSASLAAIQPSLILLGPPGAGKGTFSQFVKDEFAYVHLSVGDLVREEIDQKTSLGQEAESFIQKGVLLPESMIQTVVQKHLTPILAAKKTFILDGFPRTPEAVTFLKNLLAKYEAEHEILLVLLKAPDTTCEERITSRLMCKKCHYVYNQTYYPPAEPCKCDHCGGTLAIRSSDNREAVLKRLEEYHTVTENSHTLVQTLFPSVEFQTDKPLISCLSDYYKLFTSLAKFDGEVDSFTPLFSNSMQAQNAH